MSGEGPKRLRAVENRSRRRGPAAKNPPWLTESLAKFRTYLAEKLDRDLVVALGLGLTLALILVPGPTGISGLGGILGSGILSGLLLRAAYRYWLARLPLPAGGKLALKDLVFLASLVVLMVLIARGYHLFTLPLSGEGGVDPRALAFGAPLSFGPLLASHFLGPLMGMLVGLCAGVPAALIWDEPTGLLVYFLLTGVVASHLASKGRTRLELLKAGMQSAVTGALVLSAVALMQGWFLTVNLPAALVAGTFSGLVGGVLALGLAPLAEPAFTYTTDSRLLELASLDHPALQDLMLKAPGTYHHSLVVSSMVEAAAQEIGAQHLLAKVAALYHDIGKVKKSSYFVENQGGGNRHEKLAPSMSALILISHLKEGVELAQAHRLGQPIRDIMAQHHGTRIIKFFFNKAVEQRAAAGRDEPDPENFRYPGPRPQTREAALVMLADSVEAASRTLENPNPSRIQGLVQTQINNIFAEGQLGECELTLKDLHRIAKSFNTILNGIFHQRVEYPQSPGAEEKAGKRSGDSNSKSARQGTSRLPSPKDEAGADLKRLGLSR